jgi:hypothetical protein
MINNWKETDRNNFHNTNQNYKLNIFFLFFFSSGFCKSASNSRLVHSLKPEMEWRNNQLSSAWLIRVDPAPVT